MWRVFIFLQVYDAYSHAFDTLHSMAPVQTMEQNAEFTVLLKRLVDDHGARQRALHSSPVWRHHTRALSISSAAPPLHRRVLVSGVRQQICHHCLRLQHPCWAWWQRDSGSKVARRGGALVPLT